MELNLKLAQEDELRALSSIYTNHVKDLRSRREKRFQAPHFSLKILPLQSNSTIDEQKDDPTFDIIIEETRLYPHELPKITLTNPKHLPPEALGQCEKELEDLMKKHTGKEMIFEIAQHARIFLEKYRPDKSPPMPIVLPVVDSPPENDEQRIEREIKALREKHVEEEKNRRRVQVEIIEREKSQAKLARINSETIIRFENPTHRTVRCGHILHRDFHPTIPDYVSNISYICTDADSAEVYCLYEWNFINGSHENQLTNKEDLFAQYRKEISLVEQDLQQLISLRHNLLCKIIASQFLMQSSPTYTFRVLTEWPEASSLEVFDSCQVSESLLKKITHSLCDVLSFLHSKFIVHRSINSKSIFLLPNGIKLARTNFVRRLNDLHALFYEGQLPHSIQGSSKNDIYDMGLLLLNLATGRTHDYILDAPTSLSEEFQEFLQHCANGKSLDQLVMDPFLLRANASQTNFDRLISEQEDRETSSAHSNQEEMLVSAQSRLKSDFEVIGTVGRGGFGHVFKVQNKLDGCFYAVKQIILKSANKSVNKKITREVKFLSKLNHQNIVRYYSTWTEQMPVVGGSKSSITTTLATESRILSKKKPINGDSLRNHLPMTIPDLSSPHESLGDESETSDSTSSSTPSSDDEDGVFDARSYAHIDDSDDLIQFDRGHNATEKSEAIESHKKLEASSSSSSVNSRSDESIQRVLFIQMEYCEGNTLKQLIDRGILQEKPSMIWMLLREILEGLKHMHIKGIIHRDLKPGNILLDSTGHAKIGDLGLATISTLSGYNETNHGSLEQTDPRSSWSMDMKEGGLVSTAVGTTFYMAPELLTGKRIGPTEKVDIYSLGITFFEMCCPFNTSMERAKMLSELRRPEIHVPDRFRQKSFSRHYALVTQMLTHDPDKRPSAHTLLESNIIPFEQEEKFEQLLDHMINNTNNDVQSFYYRRTIAKLFQRKNNIARDATFDSDTQIDFNKLTTFHRDSRTYNTLRNSFIRIFERYGAFLIRLPNLLPAPDMYNKNECANLKFLSSTGLLVSLPFDSKVPLARFIARCVSHYGLNGLSTLKCYQIGNVYREAVTEMHPRELTECGYDIVFTESTLLPDAEILAVCQDVVSELHLCRERSVFIRLNHTELLRAILIYFDVPNDKIIPVLTAIQKDRFDSTNSSIAIHLIENGVNEQIANRIQKLMNADGPFEDIITELKGFTRGQSEKSKFFKSILDELELIVKYARGFGVLMPIYLTLRFFTLNPILDVNTFSGVIFQLASIVQRKKRTIYEIYAGGGRYDPLLAQFRRPSQKTSSNDLPHIVGVSFDVERLIQITNNRIDSSSSLLTSTKQCDTVICLGNFTIEMLNLRQKLVASGISVDTVYDLPSNLAILDEYCNACSYTHLIYRKDDTTDEFFRFRTYENGKAIADKRLLSTQIIQCYRLDNTNGILINSSSGNMLSSSYSDTEQSIQQSTAGTPGTLGLKNAPSVSALNMNNDLISAGAQLNIYIYFTESIYKSLSRKKIENQVQYKLSSLSALFTSKSLIEVFVFDQPDSLLTTIISTLSIEDENQFDASLRLILDKRSSRTQDLIRQFSDHLKELRFVKKSKLFVISSYKTDFYRFMAAFT